MNYTVKEIVEKYREREVVVIDLADFDVHFSDGRDYREYKGDTKYVAETIMEADIQ